MRPNLNAGFATMSWRQASGWRRAADPRYREGGDLGGIESAERRDL